MRFGRKCDISYRGNENFFNRRKFFKLVRGSPLPDFATIIVLKQFIFKRITWTVNERINEMVVGDSSKEKTARAKWGDVIKFLPVLSPQRATQRVGKLHHHRCVCSHVSWK